MSPNSCRVQVTGVVADLGRPTSFSGHEFLSLSTVQQGGKGEEFVGTWDSINSDDQVYVVRAANTDVAQLTKNINALIHKNAEAMYAKWGGHSPKQLPVFALAGVTALAIVLLTVGYQAVKALMNPVESLRSE